MDYKSLGRRIQERRLELSMTQEQLAEKIGLSAVFVSQIETGIRKPSLESVVKIANALHVSIDTFLKDSLAEGKEYAVNNFAAMIEGRTEEEISTVLNTVETLLSHMKDNKVVK